ncbi:DUF4352 domain-containing protein [Thermoactinomyces mirandus]|uniref:DUF4352 domain-containing protein n=1 Tax=Thermoactinomyces mirandus TaxID=2756294 RepID=A0A7W2ARQ0_9BACL|nr:DUF4352 domain-containing protein [Thermoactinomyces mirandus]MBA4601805.1 DUF4352 domain-containing protein [Thermoactinomyces mirandus]
MSSEGKPKKAKKWLIGCGSIFLAFIVLGVACTALIGESLDTETTTTPSADSGQGNQAQKKTPVAKIGDKVKAGDVSYRVDKVEHKERLKNAIGSKKPGSGEFLVLTITVWNEGKEPITLDSSMTQLIDRNGAEYNYDAEALMYLYEDGETPFLEQINPNGEKQFLIAFDVAPNQEYDFIGKNALIFSDAQVRIKLK